MGLFDTLIFEISCPNCGQIQDNWQTKQLSNTLAVWQVGDDVNDSLDFRFIEGSVSVHTSCDIGTHEFNDETKEFDRIEGTCNSWLEGDAQIRGGKFVGITNIVRSNINEDRTHNRKNKSD